VTTQNSGARNRAHDCGAPLSERANSFKKLHRMSKIHNCGLLLGKMARPRLGPVLVGRRESVARRSVFGWSFPTPSNLPLAGTTTDGSGPPLLLIAQVIIGLPTILWTYKVTNRIAHLPRSVAHPVAQRACILPDPPARRSA